MTNDVTQLIKGGAIDADGVTGSRIALSNNKWIANAACG